MPTFQCSNGDDFIVQQLDRSTRGGLSTVLKVDGNTGVVTVAGQEISSSGVIGATGAVTATNIAASGTLDVTGVSTLTGNATVGGTFRVTGATTLSSGAAVTGTLAVTGAATVSTTLGVTGVANLNGGTAITGTATVGGKTIATGELRSVVSLGRNLAGDLVMASTVAGDQLVAAFNATDATDVQTSFESTVTVTGHLQQSAATDLSAKTILFIFHRP